MLPVLIISVAAVLVLQMMVLHPLAWSGASPSPLVPLSELPSAASKYEADAIGGILFSAAPLATQAANRFISTSNSHISSEHGQLAAALEEQLKKTVAELPEDYVPPFLPTIGTACGLGFHDYAQPLARDSLAAKLIYAVVKLPAVEVVLDPFVNVGSTAWIAGHAFMDHIIVFPHNVKGTLSKHHWDPASLAASYNVRRREVPHIVAWGQALDNDKPVYVHAVKTLVDTPLPVDIIVEPPLDPDSLHATVLQEGMLRTPVLTIDANGTLPDLCRRWGVGFGSVGVIQAAQQGTPFTYTRRGYKMRGEAAELHVLRDVCQVEFLVVLSTDTSADFKLFLDTITSSDDPMLRWPMIAAAEYAGQSCGGDFTTTRTVRVFHNTPRYLQQRQQAEPLRLSRACY